MILKQYIFSYRKQVSDFILYLNTIVLFHYNIVPCMCICVNLNVQSCKIRASQHLFSNVKSQEIQWRISMEQRKLT